MVPIEFCERCMGAEILTGRRILLTRPRRQAEPLRREIEARGGSVCLCPMLEIVPVEAFLAAGWWEGYDWLVFVSANAVRFAVEAGLKSPAAKLAAIGKATAEALEKNALPVACQAPPPYTSESLLAQPPFDHVDGQRILLVRGIGGRPMLAQVLTGRGAQVCCAELYRRQPPRPETVARLRNCVEEGVDALLITSAEALANLQQAAGDLAVRLCSLPLVVASVRLAGVAGRAGFSDVTTASSAIDAEILAALEKRLGGIRLKKTG